MPAAVVRQRMQALSGMIGREAYVGGFSSPPKSQGSTLERWKLPSHSGQHEGRFHCVIKHIPLLRFLSWLKELIHQFHLMILLTNSDSFSFVAFAIHFTILIAEFSSDALDCLLSTAKFETLAIQNSDQVRNKDLILMKNSIFYGGSRYKPTSFVRTWVIYN